MSLRRQQLDDPLVGEHLLARLVGVQLELPAAMCPGSGDERVDSCRIAELARAVREVDHRIEQRVETQILQRLDPHASHVDDRPSA